MENNEKGFYLEERIKRKNRLLIMNIIIHILLLC